MIKLVWFIMDAVEQMDLKGIYNKYRLDGRGQPLIDSIRGLEDGIYFTLCL
ncbi:MAG: hypothetical protein HY097_02465 [Nitrospinae bacterium]|nr:hypothetical protein [Nitrospinota bacterium]MBI3814351.1 hypothetical protein [Nitrospinota bacterium]